MKNACNIGQCKGVPHFWLKVLGNCRDTAAMIEEYDIPILEHMEDIKMELLDGDGYVNISTVYIHMLHMV